MDFQVPGQAWGSGVGVRCSLLRIVISKRSLADIMPEDLVDEGRVVHSMILAWRLVSTCMKNMLFGVSLSLLSKMPPSLEVSRRRRETRTNAMQYLNVCVHKKRVLVFDQVQDQLLQCRKLETPC